MTGCKSVKKNIFFPDIKEESKLFFIVVIKAKNIKKIKIFFLFDFNVVHLVHPVQKSLPSSTVKESTGGEL